MITDVTLRTRVFNGTLASRSYFSVRLVSGEPMHITLQQVFLAATAGSISTLVAFLTLLNVIRVYNRQMNAQVFIHYTERYERILEQFPDDALGARFDAAVLPPQSPKLRLCVLKYLNLCAEEYYLTKQGYLAGSVWQIWERDLKRIIASPMVHREWPTLRTEFLAHPGFLEYVERVQAEVKTSKAAHA